MSVNGHLSILEKSDRMMELEALGVFGRFRQETECPRNATASLCQGQAVREVSFRRLIHYSLSKVSRGYVPSSEEMNGCGFGWNILILIKN